MSGALLYRALGCSVVPALAGSKKPLVAWKEFQSRRADVSEIHAWYHAHPDAGVIIVCGRVSGLVAVDIDPRNGGDLRLADRFSGPRAETPSGGLHLYLASGSIIPKVPDVLTGVDLQGEGAYVIAPPSIHPNGGQYRWTPGRALGKVPLPSVPGWLRQRVQERVQHLHAAPRLGAVAPLSGDIADVLGRLRAPRRVVGGWLACCPAHDDREPSLSIAVGHSGKLLLHCFAGCRYPQIVEALDGVSA